MLDRVEQGKLDPLFQDGRMLMRVGTVDAKTTNLEGQSTAMQVLKKRFATSHAMCIHLNLIGLGAHFWYTWRLASRIETTL